MELGSVRARNDRIVFADFAQSEGTGDLGMKEDDCANAGIDGNDSRQTQEMI